VRVISFTGHLVLSVWITFLDFLLRLTRIYSRIMQTPTNLNNQQAWGGQDFCYDGAFAEANEHERTFVLRKHFRPSSRVGFVASDSDDLFHPSFGAPSPHIYKFRPLERAIKLQHSAITMSYRTLAFILNLSLPLHAIDTAPTKYLLKHRSLLLPHLLLGPIPCTTLPTTSGLACIVHNQI
jgi:hypothetical protein